MLRLKNTKNSSDVFMVVKPDGYTVGRKDCSIKIEGDQSISRKHAVLTVSHPVENISHPERLPSLELKDSSKYGTVVNGSKMDLGGVMTLKPGDTITFGALNSNSWRVEYEPLVAACSGLPGKDKQGLKKILSDLGGHLVSEWTDSCTLLVMKQVNVTAKVIGALLTCRHIVTPRYLKEYLDAVSESRPILPDPSSFLPPVVERAINQDSALFTIKDERKTMLREKTFVFLSEKQHKRLHAVIELAGGRTILYTSGACSPDMLKDPQTCVLQSEMADHTQTPGDVTHEVNAILKRNKLRMVAEAELGLAVLTVSTAVYCNPSVPKEGLKLVNCMKDSQYVNPATQKVLATDTQLSSEVASSVSGENEVASPSPLRRKEQDISKSFKSPAVPKNQPPLTPSSKQDEKYNLPTSSGVSLFSKSDVSEDQCSEDPFADVEPSRERRTIKRSRPPDDQAPHPRDVSDLGEERKRIKTEPVEDNPVIAVKQEEVDEPIAAEDLGHATHVKTVKTEVVEEIFASEEPVDENDNQSQVEDSEGSQSQWKQNKKRRRLMSEDDDKKSAAVVSEPINGDEHPSEDLSFLPGFISKNNRPNLLVKEETTSFESELPNCLMVVKSVSLIQPKPATKTSRKINGVTENVKNFKNFKKSNYAGQRVLPRIIGGSDLEVHHNMASQASQDMFLPDPQKNSDIDRAEALADELFSVEPRVRRVR